MYHVVQAPPNTGLIFFNYSSLIQLKTFSTILLALKDAHCCRCRSVYEDSDEGMFAKLKLGKTLQRGTMNG